MYKANAKPLDTTLNDDSYGISYLPHICVIFNIIKPNDQNRY